ncbi:hypothetical protein HMPREF1319_1134 [Capnocytophaga ochracea str. Holt 25]|nr:hypothetical protein HMPREF1319_1134 [Capnocytophaga ochracea str. Holt 25]
MRFLGLVPKNAMLKRNTSPKRNGFPYRYKKPQLCSSKLKATLKGLMA